MVRPDDGGGRRRSPRTGLTGRRDVVARAGGGMATTELAPVWSCATSLRMCLSRAAPPVAPGRRAAHPAADRAHVILEIHARQLVLASGGDLQWLIAVASAARRRAHSSAHLRDALAVCRRRLGRSGNRRWRFALSALSRDSRAIVAAQWAAGAEIAEAATALLGEAGDDPAVRTRILADAHRLLCEVDWSDLVGGDPPVADLTASNGSAREVRGE